jgi:glycosyl transferase family 87
VAATIHAARRVAAPPPPAAPLPAGAPPPVPRVVAESAACVQVLLGGAIVLAAAERRSVLTASHQGRFSGWFAGPLQGLLPSLTRDPATLKRDLGAALIAMLAAWSLVLLGGRAIRPAVVIGAVAALHGIFLLCPAFALTDLFNYLGYARLDAVHHLDPYVQLPLLQRGDPVYAYSNWHGLRSPYGPLFTLLLLPVARLPLPVAYWTYKALATAASLGMLAAVGACARRLGRAPAPAVAFVGLNPVVLVYALGGKHNDLLMMACLMAGCLLVLAGREGVGGAALAAAIAIKASAGLMAPVVALAAPRRGRALGGLVAGALALGAVTLLAFGPHLPDLRDQNRLVSLHSFPNVIGLAIGRGGEDAGVRSVATLVLAIGVAACAVAAWRTRRWPTPAGLAALAGVVCVSWMMPWYVLWALPFAALSRSAALRIATVLATVWVVLFSSGLVPAVLHDYGVYPTLTPVARAHRRIERTLLEGRPPPRLTGRQHRANHPKP